MRELRSLHSLIRARAPSNVPPLPEGAVGWCACPACPLPIYPGEGRFCDLCWPVGCGCGCICQCQCDPVERTPRQRRLGGAEQRQCRIDFDLAERVMQVFKDWLGLRRGEWRERLAKLPHFDLNESDASDDESPGGGQHSTSRGTHNLSMTGDMPIAQYSMDEYRVDKGPNAAKRRERDTIALLNNPTCLRTHKFPTGIPHRVR